jgi:hypothetical protein
LKRDWGTSIAFSPIDKFKPENNYSFAELWKMKSRALGFPAFRSTCVEDYAGVSDSYWYGAYSALCSKGIPLYGKSDTSSGPALLKSPGDAVTVADWEVIKNHLNTYFGWTLNRIETAEIMKTIIDESPMDMETNCLSKFEDIAHHTPECVFANYVYDHGYMQNLIAETEGTFFFPKIRQEYGMYANDIIRAMEDITYYQPTGCSGIDKNHFFAHEVDSLCEAGLVDSTWGTNVDLDIARLDAYKAAWKYSLYTSSVQ